MLRRTDVDPGNIMLVYPDKPTAHKNCRQIQSIIDNSPRLNRYMTGRADDFTADRIQLLHLLMSMAWAGSVSSLGNITCRYLVLDELDKYVEHLNARETSPDKLAEKRLTTFEDTSLTIKLSTPTIETGLIWQAYTKEAQVRFEYLVQCPDCKQFLKMEPEQIKIPENESDPEKIEAEKLAWYECQECGSHWNDEKRNQAVQKGFWRDIETKIEISKYMNKYRPAKIGALIPADISWFVSLSKNKAAELKAGKDRNAKKDYYTQYRAVPFKDHQQERPEQSILLLIDKDTQSGVVPGQGKVRVLLAHADTHKKAEKLYFKYEIRAFGSGVNPDSWQIKYGSVFGLRALAEIVFGRVYKDLDGNEYSVFRCGIDAMGSDTTTTQIYHWCRQYRMFLPTQGNPRIAVNWRVSNRETFPDGRPIPGDYFYIRLIQIIIKIFWQVFAD